MKYLFVLYLIALTFGFASTRFIKGIVLKELFPKSAEIANAMGKVLQNPTKIDDIQNQNQSSDVVELHQSQGNNATSEIIESLAELIAEFRNYSSNETLSEVPYVIQYMEPFFPVQLDFYGEHVVFELKEYLPEIIFPKIEKVKKSPLNHFCIQDEGQTIAITKDDGSVGLLLRYLVKHKNSITILWCPLDLVRVDGNESKVFTIII